MLRPNDVQIDASLSTLGTETMNLPNGFIADQVLPPLPVEDKLTFEYPKFGAEHANDDYDTKVGPTGETNEIGHKLETETGTMTEQGLHETISVDITEIEKPPVNTLEDATRTIISKLMLGQEQRVKTLIDDTATYEHDSPSVKWDASTGTITILRDIQTGASAFFDQAGIRPNVMVVPQAVFDVIRNDPTLADILKYWMPQILFGTGIFPEIEGMRVLIPGVAFNTAEPGLTVAMGKIWDSDNVILAHVNPVAGPRSFSVGWQFRRKLYKNWNAIVRKTALPLQNAWWVEARYWNAEKVTCPNAIYIIDNVLT